MDPNLQIKANLGCKELLLKKLSFAVTSSVLSQVIILCVFLFVISFNLFHPVQWLYQTFRTFASVSTWLYVVPFLSIIFAQSIICAKDYVLQSKYCSTRMQKFFAIFSIRNLLLLMLHVLIGGLSVWLFLSLAGRNYGGLYVTCKNDRSCLVRETFFLMLCGMWTGLYFFLRIYTSDKRIIFPVVQQSKLLQFKSRLVHLIKDSHKAALLPSLYYFIFYFAFGDKVERSFTAFFHLHLPEDSSLNILGYIYSWYIAALYMFNMNLMRFFFELFLTESMEFPIVALQKNDLTLIEAVNVNSIPIIQHLAALDVFLLSYAVHTKSRREVLFTLSQPGNHPHLWNRLVECTLKILSEFSEMLNKSTNAILNPESTKKLEIVTQSPLQSPLGKDYPYRNMRNMLMQNVPLDIVTISHNRGVSLSDSSGSLAQKMVEKLKGVVTILKAKLGINYLFGELPVINIQCCLSNGQIIIWLAEGLSTLVVASLREDKFGVVQKDIPIIISTLIELKQSVEKLNKVPALTRKGHTDDFSFKMRVSVSSAVKRSLYKICRNFGPYLTDLPLNKDVTQLLHSYISDKGV